MAFNFALAKAKARRAVHSALSVHARYESYSPDVPAVELSVRWHNKIAVMGDLESGGYASVIEGIERIIFDRTELKKKGVHLDEGDRVYITAEGFDDVCLTLKTQEPIVGPVEVIWQIARGQ